jgi:mannosyltransferase
MENIIEEKRGLWVVSRPNNLVIGIAMVAAFFSFLHIGDKSVWFDEAHSIFFAKMPWRDLWTVLVSKEANQGLYYILLKFWLVFGDSEFAVRALSALFAVASIPFLYALANRLLGVRAGLAAVLLLSVNAYFIEYAQEARGYSLVLFLVILSSYLFVRMIQDPDEKITYYGYIIVGSLAVYAHFFAALVVAAQAFSVPFLPPDKSRTRRLSCAGLVIAALITPIIYFILTKDTGQISWIPRPSLNQLKILLMDLSGDVGHRGYLTSVYVLPCVIAVSYALVTLFKAGRSMETWRYAFAVLLLGVPVFISFAFSFIKPILLNKYLIVSMPGIVLLAGIGVSSMKNRFFYPVMISLLVVLSVFAIIKDYYPKKKENFRDSVSYIVSNAQHADGIIIYFHYNIVPFEYYMNRFQKTGDLPECAYPSSFGKYQYLESQPALTVPYLESLNQRYDRIWVFIRKVGKLPGIDKENNYIVTAFEKNFQLKQEKKFGNLMVLLFEK